MRVKMIVTDLDNTLLRRDKTVSDYTVSVFRRCHDMGMKIVLATARPVRAVKEWLALPVERDACIYHNGAVVEIENRLFRETGIDRKSTDTLLQEAVKLGCMRVAVEIDNALYANFDAAATWPGMEFVMSDFRNLPEASANKVVFLPADKSEKESIEKLLGENLYCDVADNTVLMVMNKQARKRNAVRDIAEHYGLSFADVVAFGDDHNDVEMLRESGIGVAVASAIDEAKAVADCVCGDCDEDGVAQWLEENLLCAAG